MNSLYPCRVAVALLIITLTEPMHAAPLLPSTETHEHQALRCCFLNGRISFCDVLVNGVAYCKADGKIPAIWTECTYINGSLVPCETKTTALKQASNAQNSQLVQILSEMSIAAVPQQLPVTSYKNIKRCE